MGDQYTGITETQALLVEESALSIWDDETDLTQAGPQPGTPLPAESQSLVLGTHSAQTDGDTTFVRVVKGGFAGRNAAGFTWRNSEIGEWFGQEGYGTIAGTELIGFSASDVAQHSALLVNAVGQLMHAYQETDDPMFGGSTFGKIRVAMRGDDGVWTEMLVVDSTSALSKVRHPRHPGLVLLPDGRIVLFFVDIDDADRAQVHGYVSEDNGSTWDLHAPNALLFASSTTWDHASFPITRATWASSRSGDQIVLALSYQDGGGDRFVTFGSSDTGASFTSWATDFSGEALLTGYTDVVAIGDSFVYLGHNSPADSAQVWRSGSAFDVPEPTSVAFPGHPVFSPDLVPALALVALPDDSVLAYGIVAEDGVTKEYRGMFSRSWDGGLTWVPGTDWEGFYRDSSWWSNADAAGTMVLSDMAGVWYEGSVMLAHKRNEGGNFEGEISGTFLAGWSNVTMPHTVDVPTNLNHVGWDVTYMGFDFPENVGFDPPAGGGLTVLNVDGLLVNGPRSWDIVVPGPDPIVNGATFQYRATGTLTASLAPGTPQGPFVRFTLDSTIFRAQFAVEFLNLAVVVHDVANGTSFPPYTLIDTGAEYLDIRATWKNEKLTVWVRQVDGTPDDNQTDRTWIKIVDAESVPPIVVAANPTQAELTVGCGLAGAVGTFRNIMATCGYGYEDFDNLSELSWGDLAARPIMLPNGLSISMVDGPAIVGDQQRIVQRYSQPIEHVTSAHPSPRIVWRSVDDSTDSTIAWQRPIEADTKIGNHPWGLMLSGCNWRTASLDVYRAGAWTTLHDIDLAEFDTIAWARFGDSVCATADHGSRYIRPNELAGWTFDLDGTLRKVRGNTGGYLVGDNQGTKAITIYLDGVDDGGDLAAGSAGALISPQSLIVLNDSTTYFRDWEGIRLVIASGQTVDGYHQCGRAMIGHFEVFGWRNDWGKTYDTAPNAELYTARDGVRRSRSYGPVRRTWSFGYTDGVCIDPISYFASASGDYLGEPERAVALRNSIPQQLDGLLTQIGGLATPVVLVENFPLAEGVTEYRSKYLWLYGRITNELTVDNVSGDENRNQLVRVSTLRIEEEI